MVHWDYHSEDASATQHRGGSVIFLIFFFWGGGGGGNQSWADRRQAGARPGEAAADVRRDETARTSADRNEGQRALTTGKNQECGEGRWGR